MSTETAQETGAQKMRWYTVHVYSSMEKSVQRSIIERIGRSELKDLFGEVLLPIEKVEENRNGRKFETERRMYPGYVFVEMVMTEETWHLINSTPRVIEFLGNNHPVPLSDAEIAAMAGFSLGEYAALTAAGVISGIADGVELMEHRGRYMGEAGRNEAGENIGTMAAAIGDPAKVRECVELARQDGILVAANINAPTQTVVSGDREAVARFTEIAKEARLRVTPLAVGSAFHSPMMSPASEKMRSLILTKKITPCDFPVYSNLTARPISEYRRNGADDLSSPQTAEDIADAMALQLMSPVQWVKTVENLKAQGIDTVIEFGPGKTLSGLVKNIVKTIRPYNVENAESLENALSELCRRDS